MKIMNSSKKKILVTEYEEIMKHVIKKNNNSLHTKSVDWQNGENFEIFTLFKKTPTSTTSTDSCLISSNNA